MSAAGVYSMLCTYNTDFSTLTRSIHVVVRKTILDATTQILPFKSRAPPLHAIAHAYIVWPVSRPQIDCFLFEKRLGRNELAASCDCTCKDPNTAAHLLSKCDVYVVS